MNRGVFSQNTVCMFLLHSGIYLRSCKHRPRNLFALEKFVSDFPFFLVQNNEISVIMKFFWCGPKSHAGADEKRSLRRISRFFFVQYNEISVIMKLFGVGQNLMRALTRNYRSIFIGLITIISNECLSLSKLNFDFSHAHIHHQFKYNQIFKVVTILKYTNEGID